MKIKEEENKRLSTKSITKQTLLDRLADLIDVVDNCTDKKTFTVIEIDDLIKEARLYYEN